MGKEVEKYRLAFIQKSPDPAMGIAILEPKFSKSTALEIASGLIFNNNQRQCTVVRNGILVYSPQYLNGVKNLEARKRTQHIEIIANSLRRARAVIFQQNPTRNAQPM